MCFPPPAKFGPLLSQSFSRAGVARVQIDPRYAPAAELVALCCRSAGAAVVLLEDDAGLVCRALWGSAQRRLAEVDKFCRRVLWQRELIVYADDSPAAECALWAGAPILLPETQCCVGVLVVLSEETDAAHPAEAGHLLELLAAQVALIVHGDHQVREESRRMTLFIAKVSHELRTPLNGILGCSALLQSRLGGSADAETAEMLRQISASAEHNLQTVNQILDFAKLDAGRVELERLPFNLRECVEEVMAMLPVDRKPRDVELGYEMAEDAEVVGDPHRLKQVLLNLLSNALKFTTQGSVVLSVQLQHPGLDDAGPGGVHFTVRDTGVGIAPEAAQTLFQPYSQGSASVTRTHGGTGLGLAISRMLAEAMG
eukprot:EG_transcript_16655